MEDNTVISDLVSEGLDTIEAQELVRAAQRRMEAQTLRSLIVVDGDRPVGVVKWRDLRSADADSTVATCMTTDFPVLRKDMHVTEAHGHIGDVDFDNIPVIDEEGRLVGEVPRGAIVHHEVPTDHEDHVTATGDPAIPASDSAFPELRAGMDVVDVDGGKLGKVTELSDDPTTHRLAHVLVEHGLLRKKHKRLPTDTIGRVDGDTIVLKISKTEWGFLSDIEDQDI
jgi:predicted transcriptional regulator